MDESRGRLIVISIGVVVLAVVVFVLWRGMGPSTPAVPAGQSLQNPVGTAGTARTPEQQPKIQPGPGMPTHLPPGIPPGMGPAPQPGGASR